MSGAHPKHKKWKITHTWLCLGASIEVQESIEESRSFPRIYQVEYVVGRLTGSEELYLEIKDS
jgi:hypothetical protein